MTVVTASKDHHKLTAVFILVDHSRDVPWKVPCKVLVMTMWFINLKSAVILNYKSIYYNLGVESEASLLSII